MIFIRHVSQWIKAQETDSLRPKRDRRTALRLFGELQAPTLTKPGGYANRQDHPEQIACEP